MNETNDAIARRARTELRKNVFTASAAARGVLLLLTAANATADDLADGIIEIELAARRALECAYAMKRFQGENQTVREGGVE